jgi:hypothetical protein
VHTAPVHPTWPAGEFSEHGGRLVNFRGFIGFDAGG